MDLLPDHFHEVLDVSDFRGLGRFTLIGVFLTTRGRGSVMPQSPLVQETSIASGYEE